MQARLLVLKVIPVPTRGLGDIDAQLAGPWIVVDNYELKRNCFLVVHKCGQIEK
jgi:hypothetical protein